MTFKCPYTEVCRADGLRKFADMPGLAVIFNEREQCGERDPERAHRCAARLRLTEKELPTLGKYVQDQRRAQGLRKAQFAERVGVNLEVLRDLELNKIDPKHLSRRVLENIAAALSAPADYLVSLARLTSKAGTPRQGTVFARNVLNEDETAESEQ